MRICLTLLLLLTLPIQAGAQTNAPHQALDNTQEILPWQAVGRLDFAPGGFCTGTLISPKLVLTAGHCLYTRTTGALLNASDIMFRAGYRNGYSPAIRRAKRFKVHRDYTYHGGRNNLRDISKDIAVIELQSPIIDPDIRPFQRYRKPAPRDRVTVISYARGREKVPSIEKDCVMTHIKSEVLHYTCDIDFGASGAPVFIITNQGPKIASVVSSGATKGDRTTALGVSMGITVDTLVRQLNTSNQDSRFVKVGTQSLNAQLGRKQSTTSGLPQIKP